MIDEDLEVEILFHVGEGKAVDWIAKKTDCAWGAVQTVVERGCLRKFLLKEARWHEVDRDTFLPSPAEILLAAAEIRDRGFHDEEGQWHSPWSPAVRRGRVVQRAPAVEAIEVPVRDLPEGFRRLLLDESELL